MSIRIVARLIKLNQIHTKLDQLDGWMVGWKFLGVKAWGGNYNPINKKLQLD